MPSPTEENYLKIIFHLSENSVEAVPTNAISVAMQTTAASVTDMLKRLAEKGLADYARYKGVSLTPSGRRIAMQLVRRHRLWEVFLVDKLGFAWDEVHPIAEELEHVASDELIRRLDTFLGNPKVDPHGDPIPSEHGHIEYPNARPLSEMPASLTGNIVGVREHSPIFLQHLQQQGLILGTEILLIERFAFDQSLRVRAALRPEQVITHKVAELLLVSW